MSRSIEKAIEQYHHLTKDGTTKGCFTADDIQQLLDMSVNPDSTAWTIFNAITNSLEAGYAIGYRTAIRRERERRC